MASASSPVRLRLTLLRRVVGLAERRLMPCALELGEELPLPAVVLHDEHDERGHGDEGHGIGGADEGGVRAEIGMGGGVRPQAEAARSTCTWRSACTRRRKISARMAMRCSSTNSRVKPAAMTSSGHSSEGSMVGPPRRMMLAG